MKNKFKTPNARFPTTSGRQEQQHQDGVTESDTTQDVSCYDIGAPTPKALLQRDGEQPWDCVVLNDYTQSPARPQSREETIRCLRENYVPVLPSRRPNYQNNKGNGKTPMVVFLQTFAYKVPDMRNTQDLGTFATFTQRVVEGYDQYRKVVLEELQQRKQDSGVDDAEGLVTSHCCRVAPVGQAFLWLHQNQPSLWEKLYSWDDYHPSPHGT